MIPDQIMLSTSGSTSCWKSAKMSISCVSVSSSVWLRAESIDPLNWKWGLRTLTPKHHTQTQFYSRAKNGLAQLGHNL